MIDTYLDGVNRPTALEIKVGFLLLLATFVMIPVQAHAAGTLISSIVTGTTVKPEPSFYSGACSSIITSVIPNGVAWSIWNTLLYSATSTTGPYTPLSGGTISSNPAVGGSNAGDYICNPANNAGAINASGFADGTYYYMYTNGTTPTGPADPSLFYIGFTVNSGVIVPSIVTGDTAIYTVDPVNNQVLATTSIPYDFTTIGNINASDWKEGIRLRIKIDRNTDQQAIGALTAFNSANGNYTYLDIPVTSGTFLVSTTTINTLLPINRTGTYSMVQEIQTPGIGVHWWIFQYDLTYNTLAATTTTFTVGTSTAIDNITNTAVNYLNNIASSTSQGDPLATCQFSWFSSAIDFSLGGKLINCMGGLVVWALVPSPGSIALSYNSVRDGVLSRAPWGYATRLVTVFTSASAASTTATTTLQSEAQFTVPIYLTGTSTPDTTLTFNPGDMLDGGAALLNGIKANGTDKNLRDITEPFVMLFISISLLIIIFHDLMQMGQDSMARGSGEGSSNNRDPSAYREWLYNRRK